MDQVRVLKLAAHLALNLDQVEIDVQAGKISYCKNCLHADLSQLVLAPANHLGPK
eukprot:CAMPEP_0115100210 /NCGR_PEP_ID=MMETSP0227-20121206/32401_1 /TAXON_ID=89957 /ORGANISM="Polarella glacialis, Strain CCMP 1383" /LENGTH=54 /DNA_ID=CAMNT_0002495527 /DNA_START=1 /DNA_END=162 /DNA_ORIENTATION=-